MRKQAPKTADLRTTVLTRMTPLGEANEKLKAAGLPCSIQQKRHLSYLQATLPEKSDPSRRRQQKISLGEVTLRQAELKAKLLGASLLNGSFDWHDWGVERVETNVVTIPEFIEFAKLEYLKRDTKNKESQERHLRCYLCKVFERFPDSKTAKVNIEMLKAAIQCYERNTQQRQTLGYFLARTWEALGHKNADEIRDVGRGYTKKMLTPRDIPSDQEIEEAWHKIRRVDIRWAWGACAVFGVRPHELTEGILYEENHPEFDNMFEVSENTKTGNRKVWTNKLEWIEKFDLHNIYKPSYWTTRETMKSEDISQHCNQYIKKTENIHIPMYALRHAFAIRCMTTGVPVSIAAKLMGHTYGEHTGTYQYWFNDEMLLDARDRYQK